MGGLERRTMHQQVVECLIRLHGSQGYSVSVNSGNA